MGRVRNRKTNWRKHAPKKSRIEVRLYKGQGTFEACATVPSQARSGMTSCAKGQNPRVSVARALRTLASRIQRRSGAFKGLR